MKEWVNKSFVKSTDTKKDLKDIEEMHASQDSRDNKEKEME